MEWTDIEHLATWVLEKRFKDYNHDMLGESEDRHNDNALAEILM